MPLEPGTKLGHYEVVAALGAGGMGEVYRASDATLGREVAIKVLPASLAGDPERLARFEREARALAALNHPNVATVHGFERQEGTSFLVMELVEGDTLADRIARGPLPVGEAIVLFRQIAEGLAAAHAKGIVHRDLKPANIKIGTAGGSSMTAGGPKILDFGLAKAMTPEAPAASGDPGLSASPTLTLAATQRGEILGTAAYMSPEQASGEEVDERADVWAFGVCLFEALTGKRLFDGDKMSKVLAAVLMQEPDFERLPADAPPALLRLLRRCLEKEAPDRLHSIADARLELRDAAGEPAASAAASAPVESEGGRRVSWALVAAALVAVAAVAGVLAWSFKPQPPRDVLRSVLSAPPSMAVAPSVTMHDLAITPDGSKIIYSVAIGTTRGLYLRPVDRLEGSVLVREGPSFSPFVSPDGEWVGYCNFGAATLERISILGGPSVTLVELPQPGVLRGASWGDDERIVYAAVDVQGLWRVPAAGGEAESLTAPDTDKGEIAHAFPYVLPGSAAVLFTILDGDGGSQIAVLDLESGEIRTLIPGGMGARYASSGHLVYGTEGTLRAVAFDLPSLEVVGNPVPVLEGVVTKGVGVADFDLSRDGRLVYVAGRGVGGFATRVPVWVDRQGGETAIDGLTAQGYEHPRLSPDGRKAAFTVAREAISSGLWIWDFDVGNLTRLTFSPGQDLFPSWSPDGERVAFASNRDGTYGIYSIAASGAGRVERLTKSDTFQAPMSFSPDGRRLVYRDGTLTAGLVGGSANLFDLVLDGDGEGEPLLTSPAVEQSQAALSPNGRWLAYRSFESGQTEVYVRPYPNVEDGRWQVSTERGYSPLWSRDGQELFYRAGLGAWAVPVDIEGDDFSYGTPERMFAGPYFFQAAGRQWDVSPDGQRFLMLASPTTAEGSEEPDVVMVDNWFAEFERIVPAD